MELPRNLVRAAEQDDAGPGMRAWLADLPHAVDDAAGRWSLRLGRPFQPGGATAWVAPARGPAGQRRVLKVGWRHDEAAHEADGLLAWGGRGSVRLYDAQVTGPTAALLLEACEPGAALSDTLPPPEQDVVVAGLLQQLWIRPPAGHPFRSLQSMCSWWADEFEARYVAGRARGTQLDPGLARTGADLFRRLPGTATRSVLMCTDLHAGNVLAARRRPWLVVDPKPYVGDPTYDVLQHMLNNPDRLAADAAGFARRMADLTDLDGGRLRLWLFARCVQESVDQPLLQSAAIALAP